MNSNTGYRNYPLFVLLGGILIGSAGGAWAASPAPSGDNDLKTRGPAGTVKISPEPGVATPKPAALTTAPQTGSKPLNFTVNYVYRRSGQGPLKPLVDGGVLNSGDHYKIQFTPSEDGYIYIFQVDSTKAIYRLFPMTSFGGVQVNNVNPVRAGVTYYLPARDKSFQLDNVVGTENIVFMAFRQPNQDLEQKYESLAKAREAQDSAKVDNLQTAIKNNFKTRGLAAIVDDPKKETATVTWKSAESFTMPLQRLDNLCEDCMSIIEFQHK